MATASKDIFAFELLNKSVDNQLCKKEDVIIVLTHWFLIKNGFKCIGLGDSKTIDENEEGSECLPDGWNNQDFYSLRYIINGNLCILLGRRSDNNLLLNLLRVKDNCVSNAKFPIESTVHTIHGSLSSQIPNHQNIIQELHKHLVEPIWPGTGREISTQTTSHQRNIDDNLTSYTDDNPLRVGPPRAPQRPRPFLEEDPREVGRRDLNPFAGIGPNGGGMIFDPFPHGGRVPNPMDPFRPNLGGPARLPPGAIPPGARFDPFGPPDVGRPRPQPRNPDHDHFPPPGYDDMFM